jgi:hypothetical protein
MALLDRLKERAETDLSDTELEAILAAIEAEVLSRFGAAGEITIITGGGGVTLDLARPIDETEDLTVTERTSSGGTELASTDYLVKNGGRTLERVGTLWSSAIEITHWSSVVEVTYTPIDESAQREDATIRLALLEIEYEAVSGRSVGDVSTTDLDYHRERERLLTALSPRRGLYFA